MFRKILLPTSTGLSSASLPFTIQCGLYPWRRGTSASTLWELQISHKSFCFSGNEENDAAFVVSFWTKWSCCHVTGDRALPALHPAITSSALAMNSFVLAVLEW